MKMKFYIQKENSYKLFIIISIRTNHNNNNNQTAAKEWINE